MNARVGRQWNPAGHAPSLQSGVSQPTNDPGQSLPVTVIDRSHAFAPGGSTSPRTQQMPFTQPSALVQAKKAPASHSPAATHVPFVQQPVPPSQVTVGPHHGPASSPIGA